jgi:hypothetical protein
MKKLFFLTLAMALSFALTSITFSADEALSPENLSGIWDGYGRVKGGSGYIIKYSCKILITPTLSGILRCATSNAYVGIGPEYYFDQGEIINNELVVREREKPDIIRIKANINSKNVLEGTIRIPSHSGDLLSFKKNRSLTDEEKQHPVSQLESLVKY